MPTDHQLPALFELVLNSDEAPEVDDTVTALVEAGQTFTVRCVAEENFEHETIRLEKEQEDVEKVLGAASTSKKTGRIEVHVPAFDVKHSGLYQCEASTIDGVVHSRQLRISAKRTPIVNEPCPPNESGMCGDFGVCGMMNNVPTCFCHYDFVGPTCSTRYIKDLQPSSTSPIGSICNLLQIATGASGGFSVICITLMIFFGLMYFKERRKARKMTEFYGPLPTPINVYGELPENPYKYSDVRFPQTEEGKAPSRTDSLRNAFRLAGGKRKEELVDEQKAFTPSQRILNHADSDVK